VLVPDAIVDRRVTSGVVACPACAAEYPVIDGIVWFGEAVDIESPESLPDAGAVQALLDLSGPGGYVVLVGSAARLAAELVERVAGVHMVEVNGPDSRPTGATRLVAPSTIPLRAGIARGVVVGREYAVAAWLAEASRVVLRGRRLVVLAEVDMPPGVTLLATGDGMTVGRIDDVKG
jgi:hypothetical protein